MPYIVTEDCINCGACVVGCESEAITEGEMQSHIDPTLCHACFDCQEVCPFGAIEEVDWRDPATRQTRTVAQVIESLCHGCGNCTAACRAGAPNLDGFSHEEILAEVLAL